MQIMQNIYFKYKQIVDWKDYDKGRNLYGDCKIKQQT